MKTFLLLATLACACALTAAEPAAPPAVAPTPDKLVICDAIPGGDPTVRSLALEIAAANPQLAVSIEKQLLADALKALEAGDADLVLADESSLPPESGLYRRYAAVVALVIVNATNARRDFNLSELQSVYTGTLGDWKSLNGAAFSLHRMALSEGLPAELLFRSKVMQERRYAKAIYRKADSTQLLLLAAVNPHAIAIVGYPNRELGNALYAAAVNGIEPTLENLKSGKYPLMGYRAAVLPKKVSPQLRQFLRLLSSPEFGDRLRDNELFPL